MDRVFFGEMSVFTGLLLAFVFLVTVDAQGPVTSCVPEMKIRKNTVYQPSSESMLNISCPVTYCKEIPAVAWIKINDASEFIRISATNKVTITQVHTGPNELISYLSFKSISTDDSGIYRCMIPSANFSLESHNVNVNVSGSMLKTTYENSTRVKETQLSWIPLICIGILLLLMTAIPIFSLSTWRYMCPTINAKDKTEYTIVVYDLITSSPDISTWHA